MDENGQPEWFDDYADGVGDLDVDEYDITVSPNDFNVKTLYDFVDSGAVAIPGFQRNYVWDLRRASRLIESLVLGLPVPQLFLYEQQRNKFLVIDGQQRLMSIYYFVKRRFPRKERRVELRAIFQSRGHIPEEVLQNDEYFQPFTLQLPDKLSKRANKLKDLNYSTLGDHKVPFDLRPIRNIVVKQNMPSGDDSSIYEIFNRLNTGGITLSPQEIRTSMYHSKFYDLLYEMNKTEQWRKLLARPEPDLHMKDIEILLRGFAVLIDGANYAPSMVKFLNQFSNKSKAQDAEQNQYLKKLFGSFLDACTKLSEDAFIRNGRFNIALYEAVFTAACEQAFADRCLVDGFLEAPRLRSLEADPDFGNASRVSTTDTASVHKRLNRAREVVGALPPGSRA